jgi:hypothetical protein
VREDRRSLGSLLPFALVGLVVGHELTYALVVPDAARRDSLLLSTGHAYFPALARVALALGGVALGAWFLRELSAIRRGAPAQAFRTLALVQTTAFAALEIVERILSRVPLAELVRDRVALGIAIQIVVAWALAAVVSALGRAARRLAARRPAWRRPTPTVVVSVTPTAASTPVHRSTAAARAPPRLLSSPA